MSDFYKISSKTYIFEQFKLLVEASYELKTIIKTKCKELDSIDEIQQLFSRMSLSSQYQSLLISILVRNKDDAMEVLQLLKKNQLSNKNTYISTSDSW